MDGQVSIEHQIDIHVRDLVEAQHNPLLSLSDVLLGLEYVLAYRLRTSKPHLPLDLSKRLVNGLLLCTGVREGSFFGRKLTEESVLAVKLLRRYTEAAEEVAQVLGEIPRNELEKKLRPELYIKEGLEEDIISILHLMISRNGWDMKDFILKDSFGMEYKNDEEKTQKYVLPPQVLHFDRSVERVLDMYKTSIYNGLSFHQRKEYLLHYGKNNVPKPPQKSILQMLWYQLNDFMFWLLIVSAGISFYLDFPHVTSAVVLLLVVLLNVGIGMKQELEAASTLKTLSSLQTPQARVVIEGDVQMIPSTELVPGDLVVIEEGDAVPADLRLVVCNRLFMNESILTGESEPVSKNTELQRIRSRRLACNSCTGNVFMGTMVVRGSAKGVVVRTGSKTEMGQISSLMINDDKNEEDGHLKKKLNKLGKILVLMAAGLCLLVLIAGLARHQQLKEIIKVALSLAVSVIPEGLVAVLTLALATATKRLAKQNCIVKRLNVVETVGGISVIASDKTGTLTQGNMQVDRLWTSEGQLIVEREQQIDEKRVCFKECQKVALLCTAAEITPEGKYVGDPTETALLKFFSNETMNRNMLKKNIEIKSTIPFDSDRKIMAICTNDKELLCKGAPEMIMEKCSSYLLNGVTCQIDEQFKGNFERIQEDMSKKGQRCLALAIKKDVYIEGDLEFTDLIELTFIGLVGLSDPPREGVKKAIETCNKAGIRVIMITGDHPITAQAIASQIGIEGRVLKGSELDALNEESLAEMTPFPAIFARVTPTHKLLIVEALKRQKINLKLVNNLVAMTGDGVNDAPAIKRADVGIAMGMGGTDLAKQAASLVLADDNFCTILIAIQEGRRVRDNIVRFLVYLLACNSAEIWTVLAAVLLGWKVPLSAVNILWANIVADIPPSMALGMEPGEELSMSRPPTPINAPILTKWDVILILVNGFIISLGSLTIFKIELWMKSDLKHARSNAFFLLTSTQLLLVLTCKSLKRSLFRNIFLTKWMLVALVVSFGLLLMGHYVPWLNEKVLELEPVGWRAWTGSLITFLVLVAVSEIVKKIK